MMKLLTIIIITIIISNITIVKLPGHGLAVQRVVPAVQADLVAGGLCMCMCMCVCIYIYIYMANY